MTEPTWLSWVWGGVLAGGAEAVVGGLAALQLGGAKLNDPLPVTIWTPDRHRRSARQWVFRRGERTPATRDGHATRIPRVSSGAALAEIAGEVTATRLVEIVHQLTKFQRGDGGALDHIKAQSAVPQRELLTDLLGGHLEGVASALELRYARDVEEPHGLPVGRRQGSLSVGTISDMVIDDLHVAIELDGQVGHTGSGKFRDMARDNRHSVRGYSTLRYGWLEVGGNPCAVAKQVAEMCRGKGWTGAFVPCQRCLADARRRAEAGVGD